MTFNLHGNKRPLAEARPFQLYSTRLIANYKSLNSHFGTGEGRRCEGRAEPGTGSAGGVGLPVEFQSN
jgi:hypothetical protein